LKKADGLDEALIGTAYRIDLGEILVYDFDKCVDIFMDINDWTEEEAIDWVEYNVVGAYVGEDTPIFVKLSR
jgi:hypothetical protein